MLKFIFTLALLQATFSISIDDFGAIPNDSSVDTARANAQAFVKAIYAANESKTDRTVVVPFGNGKTRQEYWMLAVRVQSIKSITFQIDAEIVFPDDQTLYPVIGNDYSDLIYIQDCEDLLFTGKGSLEGQGYWWWVHEFLGKNLHGRPHLVHVVNCVNFEWKGVEMRNSPQYHMKLDDILNVEVHHMEIFSDWWGTRSDGKYNWRLPIFPLNTDGIDPSGKSVYIHDVKIQNYDDAVAVKPAHQKEKYVECAEDMLIENAEVIWGVGMTIGSVPPNNEVNCVRNITFRNIEFHNPFKAIYVKTNPGSSGSGIIENILYENINIHWPIWWGTYIGPQQQHQPDGSGPGCMFYPILKDCQTQPRVPMRDITLRNVHTDYAVLSPGIIRCNETNPCTGFNFDNVSVTGWLSGEGYITENVEGISKNSHPIPAFMKPTTREEEIQ